MNLQAIKEQRAATVARMRALVELAEREKRDLNDGERADFDKLKTEERNLSEQAGRAEFLIEAERRMQGQAHAASGEPDFEAECRAFSLVKAIAAQLPNSSTDWGREREVSQELARRSGRKPDGILVPLKVFEQRVITTALPAGGPGGNLVPTDYRPDLYIDRLRNALAIRRLGATVLSGLIGNVDIPRLKASATAGWVAENAALTPSDHQHDKISLTPKHCGALTEFSRNMIQQTSPDIEELVRRDFAALLAEEVDRAAINGSGTGAEPTGILQTSGIGDVAIGTNGGPVTWASVIDLIAAVDVANAAGSGFLANSKVVKSARKTAKVAATDSVMIMESPTQLAGYPLVSSNIVPSNLTKGTSNGVCSPLIFGDWAELLIGIWSEFDLLVNPFETTAYSKGNVQVRGMMTMTVAARHAASFAAIKDLTTP